MLLKRCAGSEGEKMDVHKIFGYIGLFSLLGLWWLGKNLEDTPFYLLFIATLLIGKHGIHPISIVACAQHTRAT